MSFQTFLYIMTLVQYRAVPTRGNYRTNYCIDNPTLGTNYKSKVIESESNMITGLAVSHHTENIYYIVEHPGTMFVLRKNHNVKERILIDDCEARGVAVDGRAPTVYVSCTAVRGILAYHELTGEIKSFLPEVHLIWQLYVPRNKSDLYTVHSSQEVHLYYENSKVGLELIFLKVFVDYRYGIVIDGDGNYFYTTAENGIAVTKILLKDMSRPLTYNAGHFENLAVDRKGRVYGTSRDDNGLYRLKADGSHTRLITPLDFNPCHVQFDVNDNVVIGSGHGAIYYMEYDDTCFCPLIDQSKNLYDDDNSFHYNSCFFM